MPVDAVFIGTFAMATKLTPQLYSNTTLSLGVVLHARTPSYSGGRGRRIT